MKLGPYLLGPNDTPENGISTGDARELAKAIPDESVDLIFTDPPYPKEYLYLYEWLATEGRRVLKSGGSLMALCGHAYLPTILDFMREHLEYHWLNCQYQPTATATATFWPKMVFIRWKPVIWFTSGKYTKRYIIQDGIAPQGFDKRYHAWGQPVDSAVYWLERHLEREKSAITFDPLTGGGTVPAICKMLSRSYLAFEIDPEIAQVARDRVRDTQPPLPMVYEEQAALL